MAIFSKRVLTKKCIYSARYINELKSFGDLKLTRAANKMIKPVLAIDIDETLAPLLTHLNDFHNDNFGTKHKIESYSSYVFYELWGGCKSSAEIKVSTFFQTSEYTSRIKPYPGAFEALSCLKLDFHIHVVTARSKNLESLTRSWINEYFPNIFENVHFIHDESFASLTNTSNIAGAFTKKTAVCKLIGAEILIDDNVDYVTDCVSNGVTSILFGDYPWNRLQLLENYNSDIVSQIIRLNKWKEIPRQVYQICDTNEISLISQNLIMAAIQLCSTNDKEVNLQKTSRLVELAYSKGARFLCLPECSAYMGEKALDVLSADEFLDGPYITSLCKLSAKYSIWLSVGGFPEKIESDSNKIFNTHLLISPAGNLVKPVYRKMHLFDCPLVGLCESKITAAGDTTCVIDIGFASVGLSVCYDLRFPELYTTLCSTQPYGNQEISTECNDLMCTSQISESTYASSTGAEIVLIPAAFTVPTGAAHWSTLLKARSIENQVYVVAAAQSGRHNERRESYGHSLIIDPWGTIVSECSIHEGKPKQPLDSTTRNCEYETNDVTPDGEVCYAVFSRSTLTSVRNKMPVHSHKRFKVIYK